MGIEGSLGRVVEHFSAEGRDGAKKERYHLSPMTCTGAAFNSPVTGLAVTDDTRYLWLRGLEVRKDLLCVQASRRVARCGGRTDSLSSLAMEITRSESHGRIRDMLIVEAAGKCQVLQVV